MKEANANKSLFILTIIALIGGLVLTSLMYFTNSDASTNTFTVREIQVKLKELLFETITVRTGVAYVDFAGFNNVVHISQ